MEVFFMPKANIQSGTKAVPAISLACSLNILFGWGEAEHLVVILMACTVNYLQKVLDNHKG